MAGSDLHTHFVVDVLIVRLLERFAEFATRNMSEVVLKAIIQSEGRAQYSSVKRSTAARLLEISTSSRHVQRFGEIEDGGQK